MPSALFACAAPPHARRPAPVRTPPPPSARPSSHGALTARPRASAGQRPAMASTRTLTLDGTPSVRLASLSRSRRTSSAQESVGGVDGWAAADAEADGFEVDETTPAEPDPAVAERATEHAASISGVDGFDTEPARPQARQRNAEIEAAGPATPEQPAGPEMLRVEMGGPSAVAVVSVMCRLAKIKRPGALALRPEIALQRVLMRRCCGAQASCIRTRSRATAASSSAPTPWTSRQARPSCNQALHRCCL